MAAAPIRSYVVEHYAAALTLDFEHHAISGSETIRIRSSQVSISEIELDANEITVDSLQVGRVEQHFEQADGYLRIHMTQPMPPGSKLAIKATFHGSPTKGLLFLGDSAYTVYNTSHWLIVNHQPSALATLALTLDVPAQMAVIANGRNLSSKRIGERLLSKWEETRAIPDFVFGFAVGPFTQSNAHVGKTKLLYLSTTHTPAQLDQIFHSTPSAVQFFAEKAGVAYPAKSYSQILITGDPEQELGDFTLCLKSMARPF